MWISEDIIRNVDDTQPKYAIEEIDIPEGWENVSITNPNDGLLNPNATVTVTATNRKINQAYINIQKVVDSSRGCDEISDIFKIICKIEGTFKYDNINYENTAIEIPLNLNAGVINTIGPIIWTGNNAPKYTVTEPEDSLPEGWSFKEISSNYTGTLKNNETVSVTCTNTDGTIGRT